jgi:hypothetical protein
VHLSSSTCAPIGGADAGGSGPRLHAWWFDIAKAEVLEHDAREGRFVPLDEARVERMLEQEG